MKLHQFAIYQLEVTAENRSLRFRSWADIQKENLQVRVENYKQVYLGTALPNDTPDSIWKRFQDKPPKKFAGSAISVSDVIVYNKDGVTTSYYVDKEQLFVIAGFIRLNSSGTLVTIDTRDFQVDGMNGNWVATEEIIVDGKQFFLMQNERFGKDAAFIVVSAEGQMVANDCYHGFDEGMIQRIREFLHPPVVHQQVQGQPDKKLENWQKAFENGEYLRSAEMSEEQNYNMIDGLANNRTKQAKKRDPKHRPSVVAKLRRKQKEIAAKNGPARENEMERNRK